MQTEPEYNFDGFRIEFNDKVVLMPLEKGEESDLKLQGMEPSILTKN